MCHILQVKMQQIGNNSNDLRPPPLKFPSVSQLFFGKDLESSSTLSHSDEGNSSPQEFCVQLDNFEKKYEILKNIGQGANGIVKLCCHRQKKVFFAVKIMNLDEEYSKILKMNYYTVRCLKHENLIVYKGLFLEDSLQKAYLLMEYKDFPSLGSFKHLSENKLNRIAKQILEGLKYLHQNNFIHRDIKPDNILYDAKTQKIFIIDFGVGRKIQHDPCEDKIISITGSPRYRAPQIYWIVGYNSKVDIWSLGVTLYELVCGKAPFEIPALKNPEIKNFAKKIQFSEPEWKNYTVQFKDLIKQMLAISPEKRLSAKEALSHFWFVEEAEKNKNCKSQKEQKNEVLFQNLFTKKKSEKKIKKKFVQDAILIDSDEEGVVQNGSELCHF